ncbi:MAG: glycosyltransferase family 4 protein [Candidatus Rokubacteria bacterium]|nr:glycosyltransferase family 4 protein [Candidatus Rokubacteria bacterium]
MIPLGVLTVADVLPLPVRGGAERVLWECARGLASRGHRVTVLGRAAPDAREATLDGVTIRPIPAPRRSALAFIPRAILAARRMARAEIARGAVDVLHLHQPVSGYGVLASDVAARRPSVYTFHSSAPAEYRLRRGMTALHRGGPAGRLGAAVLAALERACVRRATRVHVLSAYSARQLRDLYGVAGGRVVQIPGGVDLGRFRPAEQAAARAAVALAPAQPLIVTIRNLEARMGLESLLRAMALSAPDVPGARLVIGGDGSRRAALEALAGELGVADRVTFLGYVRDEALPRYYQAADLFALPTAALEGFGLVTVEALASGTPVLATPVGATPEILAPLDPRLLTRDASVEALADGLRDFASRMTKDPEGIDALRRACRRHAEARYGWERSVDALESLFGSLRSGA